MDLDGTWRFTFRPQDPPGEAREVDWNLLVDAGTVLVTPLVDGRAQVSERISGTVDGSTDRFTIVLDDRAQDLPEGCTSGSLTRTLSGRMDDGRLSGSYRSEHTLSGESCAQPGPATERGGFGAIAL